MRHERRLREVIEGRPRGGAPGRRARGRRGLAGQRKRRRSERLIRKSALVFARWRGRHGESIDEAARRLGMRGVTLRRWQRRWREDQLAIRPRGRPAERSARELRQTVIDLFGLMGPSLGLTTLVDLFPDVARGELVDLQRRYREAYRWRRRKLVHTLRWTVPGRVWAADFSETPEPIEGRWEHLLVVRDLSSSEQLEAMPVEKQDGETARGVFESQFRRQGAPLVMKLDNGPAFISEETKWLFDRWGVLALYSPPRTPSFNGSIEAGIGGLKVRAHWESARHCRAGEWTCDDVEAARRQGNECGRPRGLNGPTPDQIWRGRSKISGEERARFRAAYRQHERQEKLRRGSETRTAYTHFDRASIDRIAIVKALLELGYLCIRRRRVTPPITVRKAS